MSSTNPIPTITTTAAAPSAGSAPAPPANLNPTHQHTAASSEPSSSSTTQPQSAKLPIEYTNFPPPLPENVLPSWSIVIEFCDRCRWLHRATWIQTELFVTFGEKKAEPGSSTSEDQQASVKGITLLPMTKDETAGRFRVWLYGNKAGSGSGPNPGGAAGSRAICVYDRKVMGGFPELKHLKQLIRDVISPNQSLGHSDSSHAADATGTQTTFGTGHEPNTGTASVSSAHG